MTITLTSKELDEIWEEAEQGDVFDNSASLRQSQMRTHLGALNNSQQNYHSQSNLDTDEQLCKIPQLLGEGYERNVNLSDQLDLNLSDYEYRDDVLVKIPTNEHQLHFSVLLAGKFTDDNNEQVGEGNTLICGGGIQKEGVWETKKGQRLIYTNVSISHELFANFFTGENPETNTWLRELVKEHDWQTQLFPRTTPAIQGVAQQIFNCPFQGATKKMYLQGKALELISLQFATVLDNGGKKQTSPRFKPDTIARIHHAKDILHCRLQNPPSLLGLAEIVGVSDRTLRSGFRQLFGTTVFNYLLQKRMEKAESLLREGNYSVAEVANLVGYSHLSLFASLFKRQYGISPKQCILGKKSVSG